MSATTLLCLVASSTSPWRQQGSCCCSFITTTWINRLPGTYQYLHSKLLNTCTSEVCIMISLCYFGPSPQNKSFASTGTAGSASSNLKRGSRSTNIRIVLLLAIVCGCCSSGVVASTLPRYSSRIKDQLSYSEEISSCSIVVMRSLFRSGGVCVLRYCTVRVIRYSIGPTIVTTVTPPSTFVVVQNNLLRRAGSPSISKK